MEEDSTTVVSMVVRVCGKKGKRKEKKKRTQKTKRKTERGRLSCLNVLTTDSAPGHNGVLCRRPRVTQRAPRAGQTAFSLRGRQPSRAGGSVGPLRARARP